MQTSTQTVNNEYNKYDALLDATASQVDWAAVPLSSINPTTFEVGGRSLSEDYGDGPYDEDFFAELKKAERNLAGCKSICPLCRTVPILRRFCSLTSDSCVNNSAIEWCTWFHQRVPPKGKTPP